MTYNPSGPILYYRYIGRAWIDIGTCDGDVGQEFWRIYLTDMSLTGSRRRPASAVNWDQLVDPDFEFRIRVDPLPGAPGEMRKVIRLRWRSELQPVPEKYQSALAKKIARSIL